MAHMGFKRSGVHRRRGFAVDCAMAKVQEQRETGLIGLCRTLNHDHGATPTHGDATAFHAFVVGLWDMRQCHKIPETVARKDKIC